MTNKIIKTIKYGLASLVLAGSIYAQNPRENKIPEAPIYTVSEVPSNYCSRYAKLAAKELYGIDYPSADAWKLRDAENIDEIKLNDKINLETLVKDGKLKPGMLVGMYYPKSKYNERDEVKKAGYTHVLVYIGKDKEGKLWFADKFGKNIRKKNLSELKKDNGLIPKEVLYKRN